MKKGLKIFVDAHHFDGGYQGVRSFIKGIYSPLASSGQLDLYLGAHDIGALQAEFPGLRPESFIRYRSRSTLIRLIFEIPAILKKHQFDYAHFQYVSPWKKCCRYIVTTHDILFKDYRREFPWYYRVLRDAAFKVSLKRADIKSVPSSYSGARISFHYGIPADQMHIIPGGVEERFFSPSPKRASVDFIRATYGLTNFILCVNRIEPRKNQALLLEAFVELQLHNEGLSLVFIGDAAIAYPRFSQALRRLPPEVSRRVRHFSRIPDPQLLHFYKASRLLVYPSLAEGFGMPPLEAAALKVPVLCAGTTAMSQYVFFAESLFDPYNAQEFKAKLARRLCADPPGEDLERISRFVRRNYSWDEGRRRLLECIT
jgi:glycosyltransferase involved in cell wall biosynthesis